MSQASKSNADRVAGGRPQPANLPFAWRETTPGTREISSSPRWLGAACCLLVLLAGCRTPDPEENGLAGHLPPEGVKLRLVVVDDPVLASAIEQLEAVWNDQAGCEFQVVRASDRDLAGDDPPQADAVICRPCRLGVLAERGWIAPVSESLLQDDDGSWPEIFSLLRAQEAVWAKKVVAVPFGSPVLTCYYRADLLEKLGRRPPQTWAEYHALAELLSDRDNLAEAAGPDDRPWYGAIEPLGTGWAGTMLLARAAPYASHRENYSTVFNVDTMEPLIDGPPFVRALEELVADAALGPPDTDAQTASDPGSVRAAFWQGRCGLAVSWPTAAFKLPGPAGEAIRVGLAELPGSGEVYDVEDRAWDTRRDDEDRHVPLLAVSGRVGVVSGTSQWPEAACQLLFWLSDQQWSTEVSAASPDSTLFRRSHVESPGAWVEEPIPAAAAAEYAALTEQTLSRTQFLFALRIPGRPEYMAALDDAVQQAVRGDRTPREALQEAAARWRKITRRLGTETQRKAYWHSLGLD